MFHTGTDNVHLSKQLFKSFNCLDAARLLHVLSFKHTSPPLVSLVSAFKTKTTLSSVRFFLHWERGFHRKVHNPCPPLRQVLSYPLDRNWNVKSDGGLSASQANNTVWTIIKVFCILFILIFKRAAPEFLGSPTRPHWC